jgi:putative NADH-flavin reductase
MNIAVFGGSGNIGKLLLKELLKKDFSVKALLRDSSKLSQISESNLKLIQGNILNWEDVLNTIKDTEVVISVIGHGKNTPPDIQTKGMENIVSVMKELSISRVISLTGSGVKSPEDKSSFINSLITKLLTLVDKDRVVDGANHAEVLEKSGLDYTIIRTPLHVSFKSGKMFVGNVGDRAFKQFVSRDNIVEFIVSNVTDKRYIKKLPAISN